MEEKEIIELIDRFYSDENYAELKRIYSTRSFPDILGIGRKEMAHSAFIAWLLDPKESHGLGDFSLKQFLKILVKRDLQQGWNRHRCGKEHCLLDDCSIWSKCSTKEIAACVMNESVYFSNIKVDIERTTEDNKDGRIDILIEGKMNDEDFRLVIENKIYSKENNKQTDTYFKNYFDKSNRTLFVFLKPLPKWELDQITIPQCSCKQFIQICYQDIMDGILEPLLDKDFPQRTQFLVQEYIRCLSVPKFDRNMKPTSNIIAMSKHTSNLLTEFWDKNQALIMAILTAKGKDPKADEEEREKFNNLVNTVSKKYSFNGESSLNKQAFLRKILLFLIEKGIDLNEINKGFNRSLNVKKQGNIRQLIDRTEYNNMEKKTSYYELGKNDLWYYGQWRDDNEQKCVSKFIKICKGLADSNNIAFPQCGEM